MKQYGGVQEENHASYSPVPMPRPRQQVQLRPPVATGQPEEDVALYEPVSVNYANAYIVRGPAAPAPPPMPALPGEFVRPVPAPRLRTKVMLVDGKRPEEVPADSEPQRGPARDDSYQNVVIVRPAPASPAKPSPDTTSTTHDTTSTTPDTTSTTTDTTSTTPGMAPKGASLVKNNYVAGTAARVAPGTVTGVLSPPPLPGKVINNLHERVSASGAESDGISICSADSVRGGSGGGIAAAGDGASGRAKYKTSSPADLFKSIGNTTRLLTESIGERMAHKTKKAANNVRNTGTSLVSWGVKSVARSSKVPTDTEATARHGEAPESPKGASRANTTGSPTAGATRPQTFPSPDLLQKIKFGSPLPLKNATAEGVSRSCELDATGDAQTTYDIPKRGSKPSNLRSPDSSSTSPSTAPSSSHGGSVRASSSSIASSSGVAGLFHRNAPASQSLYSRVLPKRGRRYGSPGERTNRARPEQPAPAAGSLLRASKHKSESNLYESTFYVDRPVPASGSEHLYGKLNIIARPSMSSSSSSGDCTSRSCSVTSLNDAAAAGSEEDNNLPELLRSGVQLRDRGRELAESPNYSTRATYRTSPARSERPSASREIFSRQVSAAEASAIRPATGASSERQHRSDSWNFYDIAGSAAPVRMDEEDEVDGGDDGLSHISTPEPVYANDDQCLLPAPIYDQLSEMESLLVLQPIAADHGAFHLRHNYDEVSIADIIDEFDPLVRDARAATALEAIIENNAYVDGRGGATRGNLALIENLLGAESYSRRRVVSVRSRATDDVPSAGDGASKGDARPESHRACPRPPQRSDSLLATPGGELTAEAPARAVPAKPKRSKGRLQSRSEAPDRATASVIIHQNMSLPSGSVENLVELEEHLIEPHLATLDEPVAPSASDGVDLSYPKTAQTSWYLHGDGAAGDAASAASAAVGGRFEKRLNVDPVNERSSVAGRTEKAAKSSLPPELARPGPRQAAVGEPTEPDDGPVPSYFEAIGGTDPLFERGLAATPCAPPKAPSVATKLLNALKRRPSLNRGGPGGGSEAGGTGTVRTALEMIPKPRLTERLISHKGHVLKFPSGKIGDVLSELSPRSVVLRERIFQTYLDPQQTLPKESIQLRYIMSLQCILQHKFAGEGRLDLHCFEIVLGLPKCASGSSGGSGGGSGGGGSGFSAAVASAAMSTNPDLLITSGSSGNVKLARQSYMFGTHKRSDRNLWMAKVLQSVTDVFGGEGDLLREFLRAGWCYVKKSVSAGWAGAWLLQAKRKLYLYSFAEGRLEELDLRKARCIGAIENEPGSIGNLHVEVGPSLFIDCPPYATLYFVMGSPRETQIWHKVIRQAAHKNGPTLHSQQLTRGDVPVLIDKCVNFIYAHGSMSEGIYRKSGSLSAMSRILQLFAEDAFDVQLTRNEYNEYEVAGALKKFIRELPGSFFGSYAASFVAIGSLGGGGGDVQLKVDSYRQLLERLPRLEYCTLKKLIGHLAFIASLEKHNRMGVPNLAIIWGSTLLANASQNTVQEATSYHQQDADVVADLIRLYRRLFPVGEDELRKDQLMLAVLQKYHAAAENLSDAVKHSGDLKVWITIDCERPPESGTRVNSVPPEDKPQVNVDVTPFKTASDVCKELAGKTKYPWYKLTLYEVIGNGTLIRPIHYSEKVLEVVVRWTYWDEVDRKNNYLTLKQTTTLNDVYRTIQKAPVLTPTMELKFADRKTKALRSYQLQLVGRGLVVLKKIEKKDKGFEELLKVDLARVTAYIGCEPKRDRSSLRWAITLVDNDFKKRTRDAPYIGHTFGGLDFASQILWYSSILYSQYKDDILPSGDLFF